MTTLQESARKALACLELYDHEDLASCEARHELRIALAQQGEPVAQARLGMKDGLAMALSVVELYGMKGDVIYREIAKLRDGIAAAPAPQAQEPACPECGASLLYECVACSYTNYPKKQDMKPQAQNKSNNYLNGYCTGRTDLLKEQAAPQPAQGVPERRR